MLIKVKDMSTNEFAFMEFTIGLKMNQNFNKLNILILTNLKYLIVVYLFFALSISVVSTTFLFNLPAIKVGLPFILLREILFVGILTYIFFTSTEKASLLRLLAVSLLIFINVMFIEVRFPLIILGFKSLLPLFYLLCVPKFEQRQSLHLSADFWIKLIQTLLFCNLFFQLSHFFFGYGFYAKMFNFINSRNPGLFFFPAASACFILILSSIYAQLKNRIKLKEIFIFIFMISLCASITGVAGAFLLCFLNRHKIEKNNYSRVFILLCLSVIYLHFARLSMTGATYLEETGGGRYNILADVVKDNLKINGFEFLWNSPKHFGLYTNAAYNYYNGYLADSQISALIGNLGPFWLIVVFIFFAYQVLVNYRLKNDLTVFYILVLCSVGLNISESGATIFLAILSRYFIPKASQV